jgi:glyoxylase I family protein
MSRAARSTTPSIPSRAGNCSLHKHTQAATGTFDEGQTGLDHVTFACSDRNELQQWADRLNELGISHDGIKDANYGSGVSFRDPDGIALEFFAPPGVD